MSPIIDVDSHWILPWEFEFEKGPLKPFADSLPGSLDAIAFFMAGDLIRGLDGGTRRR